MYSTNDVTPCPETFPTQLCNERGLILPVVDAQGQCRLQKNPGKSFIQGLRAKEHNG